MQLILLRHGPAVERDGWQGDDSSRPLAPEGERKTRDVARGLATICEPALVASSPKMRARQTAELVSGAQRELWPELASDDFAAWLRRLREANAPSVLLVGHEPDLGRFASLLLSGDANTVPIEFKKASALWLELDLASGRAKLRSMLSPRLLRSLG